MNKKPTNKKQQKQKQKTKNKQTLAETLYFIDLNNSNY